jgi:hypothetical protein
LQSVTGLTSAWTRVSLTLNANASATTLSIYTYPVSSGAGIGSYNYLTGYQFEVGTSASAYTASNALGLDFATDDYVQVPDATDLAFGAAMTFFDVIKMAVPGATMALADQYDANAARSWAAFVTTAGKLQVIISADGGSTNVKNYTSSRVVADGTWHSVGFTYTGGALTLYIDGVADTNPTMTTDAAVASLFNTTANLMIGASLATAAAANNLTGSEAAIVLYPTGLSAADYAAGHNYYQGALAADGITLPVAGGQFLGYVEMEPSFSFGV